MIKPEDIDVSEIKGFHRAKDRLFLKQFIADKLNKIEKKIKSQSEIKCKICKHCHTHHIPIVNQIIHKEFTRK